LAPIASGEVVFFTDRDLSGFSFVNAIRDGTLTWTVNAPIAAGTVIRFSQVDLGTRAATIGTLTVTDTFNLSPNGETLIAYQGTIDNPSPLITRDHDRERPAARVD
jgi:hypothetical protein